MVINLGIFHCTVSNLFTIDMLSTYEYANAIVTDLKIRTCDNRRNRNGNKYFMSCAIIDEQLCSSGRGVDAAADAQHKLQACRHRNIDTQTHKYHDS